MSDTLLDEPVFGASERNMTESETVDTEAETTAVHGVRRIVYLFLAAVTFALGALGAVLPGLPTTPFLLLCSYFLVRSSPRLNRRLLRSRLFGPILRDWQLHGGVRRDVKIQAILVVLIVAGFAIVFSPLPWIVRITIAGAVVIGITVIVFLPEVPRVTDKTPDTRDAS